MLVALTGTCFARAVQFVTVAGFAQGWFKTPEMRLVNVLRPADPAGAQ